MAGLAQWLRQEVKTAQIREKLRRAQKSLIREVRAAQRRRREGERLAGELHKARLRERIARVDEVVRKGRILLKAKVLMERGFRRWLRESAGLDPSAAYNFMAVAKLSEQEPERFPEWKTLGITRLYRLARAKPEKRASLAARELERLAEGKGKAFPVRINPV